jgi:mRNA interferase MazF
VSRLTRGRIVWFTLSEAGEKPGLVVSNNRRNEALQSALVARITTSTKPSLSSVVDLSAGDPLVGKVLCDDLIEVFADEVVRDGGAVGVPTMRAVDAGLKSALGIP